MKKFIIISGVFGFALGYLTFFGLDELVMYNQNTPQSLMENHINHDSGQIHDHPKINVQTDEIPKLSVVAIPDTKSGYNIRIMTENYTFVPEAVNTPVVENEGHAHVYVNNEKVARVYSEWFHLDGHHLTPDSNTLRVTLNAHNHAEWSVNDQAIDKELILN